VGDFSGRDEVTDLLASMKSVAEDPIVIALALLVLGVITTRFLLRNHPAYRNVTRGLFFALITIALLHGQIVPYQPLHATGSSLRNSIQVVLEVVWWVYGAWLVVGILRSVLVFKHRPREAKLLQDILAGLIYLAAIFAIIAYVFNLPIQGLLATSGAIAIIIGLALQSSLGDVFSGLVLSFSRPYRPDDWVRLEGGTEGQVIELNWRATHILTSQRDLAIVPNSVIAKSKIVNVSYPSHDHGVSITIRLDNRGTPSASAVILRQALLNSRRILASPNPSILVKDMNSAEVAFELTFFVDDLRASGAVQNELFDLIHRHLAAAGIALAAPDGQAVAEGKPMSDAERLLGQVAIFAKLTPEERAGLAAKLKRTRHEAGETLLQTGTILQSLFLVGAGVISLSHEVGGRRTEVLRLGPGDHYGEVGMLTGKPAWGWITTLTPVVLYELPKVDLTPLLEARPQVAQDLSHELAQRQAAGHAVAAADPNRAEPTANWFYAQLRKLFDAGGSK
jgi:small-conductance mechanosensitive channel